MKIPKSFQLLGREWRVIVIPKSKWQDAEAVGICVFDSCEIRLMRQKREAMEHVLMHEYTHAALYAMGSKLTTNESFVDNLSGLFHQILTTGK